MLTQDIYFFIKQFKSAVAEHKLKDLILRESRKFLNFFRHGLCIDSVRMDASSICQLKCLDCAHGKNDLGVIGCGYLKFEDFKRFVDRYYYIHNIELSNWGEVFLNPELDSILEYAYSKNIKIFMDNGVNLNYANPQTLENLVRFKVRILTVSIDGAQQSTYERYKKGGDFNSVINNIRTINSFKKRYNSFFPVLRWQFIVFGYNESELPKAEDMARELGMIFSPKLSWDPSFESIKDPALIRKYLGFSSREEYARKTGRLYMPGCRCLWSAPQINWDGTLLGCTENKWTKFGNVFDKGLEECMSCQDYIRTKELLLGKTGDPKNVPCLGCFKYKEIQQWRKENPKRSLKKFLWL